MYTDDEIKQKLSAHGYEMGVIELVLRVQKNERNHWVDRLLTKDDEIVQRMNNNRRV